MLQKAALCVSVKQQAVQYMYAKMCFKVLKQILHTACEENKAF